MSFFGNILFGLTKVLAIVLDLYFWIILARALISWVNPDPRNAIVKILHQATEPVLRQLRKIAPPWKTGGIDISSLFAILIIYFLEYALIRNLYDAARGLGGGRLP